jgi:hypothetical protein
MTDRELLEAAAKASGHDPILWCGPKGWLCDTMNAAPRYYWNPLTDDGDALRLAVKLGIDLEFEGKVVFADGNFSEFKAEDPYAATRRAIVRAAAAMEKT